MALSVLSSGHSFVSPGSATMTVRRRITLSHSTWSSPWHTNVDTASIPHRISRSACRRMWASNMSLWRQNVLLLDELRKIAILGRRDSDEVYVGGETSDIETCGASWMSFILTRMGDAYEYRWFRLCMLVMMRLGWWFLSRKNASRSSIDGRWVRRHFDFDFSQGSSDEEEGTLSAQPNSHVCNLNSLPRFMCGNFSNYQCIHKPDTYLVTWGFSWWSLFRNRTMTRPSGEGKHPTHLIELLFLFFGLDWHYCHPSLNYNATDMSFASAHCECCLVLCYKSTPPISIHLTSVSTWIWLHQWHLEHHRQSIHKKMKTGFIIESVVAESICLVWMLPWKIIPRLFSSKFYFSSNSCWSTSQTIRPESFNSSK